jgi:type IV pilus assembly protein PilA
MLLKLRERMASEKGFTLIELLVVMLIIGILAAIAIPTFFNQRSKAQDADSKAMAHTAQTAMETYATDNDGSYADADVTDLEAIESSLDGVTVEGTPTATAYSVRATNSDTNHWFQINRTGGSFTYTCGTNATGETLPAGGCPAGGTWN